MTTEQIIKALRDVTGEAWARKDWTQVDLCIATIARLDTLQQIADAAARVSAGPSL